MIKRFILTLISTTLIAGFAMAIAAEAHSRDRRTAAGTSVSTAPDQVIAWNQELQTVLTAPGAQPAAIHPTRTMALTQIAVYDAVNGILGDGRPLVVSERAPRHASAAAAAAAAARTALDALLPSQQPVIDAFYASSEAQLGSGERVRRGLHFGSQVGRAVVAARADDGADATPPVFVPRTGAGRSADSAGICGRRVYPDRASEAAGAAQRKPVPAGPAAGLDEPPVRGGLRRGPCPRRPHRLDAVGRSDGDRAVLGRGADLDRLNQIADQAAVGFHGGLAQNARLFALLDTSLADGAVALYDAKYAFHRWRPITAITAQDQGNPNTTADPNWLPLANTANDPSYPGAHAEFSQAAATVLQDVFGTDGFSFTLTNQTVGITRAFDGFSQAANEASASRIFAGQHFRYDEEAGQTLGGRVADFVVDHALSPSHRHDR